ncbi:MAG: GNAT family N-acetyltransferase, partial [Cyanobacteria bacterium P01_G01_bin.67]
MKIRIIEEKDLIYLSKLYISVFSVPPWNEYWEYDWADQRLTWIFNSQGFYGYLATINDEIIGAILGKFVPFKGAQGFKILEFFVSSKYQKQGVGSQLLYKLESELK